MQRNSVVGLVASLLVISSSSVTNENVTSFLGKNEAKSEITPLAHYALYRMRGRKILSNHPEDDRNSELLALTEFVMRTYMKDCSLLVVFHQSFKFDSQVTNFDKSMLLHNWSLPIAHVQVAAKRSNYVAPELLSLKGSRCRGYIIFIKDVANTVKTIGNQTLSKVVVVTASSRWKIEKFLRSTEAKGIVNLLVIPTIGANDIIVRKGENLRSELFLNMYTHELYVDGKGSSRVRFLTSWKAGALARNVSLFPQKLAKGFNGRQFGVIVAEQPPFVLKKLSPTYENSDAPDLFDGLEIRLLKLLSPYLNFTTEIKEASPTTQTKGPAEMVIEAVITGQAEIALAGTYNSATRSTQISFSAAHSVDCAAFITRTSTALPRYRAILGPFHWHVWLALIITYFLGILPLTFADKHSFKYLCEHPWHIETMFWYMFGTFTNCFSFHGENSWAKSEKNAPRILIGWYWVFSIIVTACYTGSIIAFITLFVYPPVTDTVDQLVAENFRVGSLSTGGWGEWFNNSDHYKTKWLLRDVELVSNIALGIKNVTRSFYLPLLRPYTFLSSRAHLEYIIQTNYSKTSGKNVLYTSRDCFVPFSVAFVYPKDAPYKNKFDEFILRAQQSGLISKVTRQMNWETQRSASGRLLQVGASASLREALVMDRNLTLDDTQGMFLLLGAGFLIAGVTLLGELISNHNNRGKSWRFWNWRPKINSETSMEWLKKKCPECFLVYEAEADSCSRRSRDCISQTIDIDNQRLNSQLETLTSASFYPEYQKYGTLRRAYNLGTAASPIFKRNTTRRLRRSGSVDLLPQKNHIKHIITHPVVHDRPFSSVN